MSTTELGCRWPWNDHKKQQNQAKRTRTRKKGDQFRRSSVRSNTGDDEERWSRVHQVRPSEFLAKSLVDFVPKAVFFQTGHLHLKILKLRARPLNSGSGEVKQDLYQGLADTSCNSTFFLAPGEAFSPPGRKSGWGAVVCVFSKVPWGDGFQKFRPKLFPKRSSEPRSLPYLLRQKWWTPTVTTTALFSFLLTSHTSLWDKRHFPPQHFVTTAQCFVIHFNTWQCQPNIHCSTYESEAHCTQINTSALAHHYINQIYLLRFSVKRPVRSRKFEVSPKIHQKLFEIYFSSWFRKSTLFWTKTTRYRT
jgi:hypothetical protein